MTAVNRCHCLLFEINFVTLFLLQEEEECCQNCCDDTCCCSSSQHCSLFSSCCGCLRTPQTLTNIDNTTATAIVAVDEAAARKTSLSPSQRVSSFPELRLSVCSRESSRQRRKCCSCPSSSKCCDENPFRVIWRKYVEVRQCWNDTMEFRENGKNPRKYLKEISKFHQLPWCSSFIIHNESIIKKKEDFF